MKQPKVKPINNEDYRRTAIKMRESIEKELPILEQNLQTLESTNTIMVLPDTIHNICVIMERQAYKFLRPAYNLYDYVDSENLPDAICLMVNSTKNTISDLLSKEEKLVAEQEEQLQKEKEKALKKNKPFNERIEREMFNHLEADISPFYRKLLYLMIIGSYYLTPDQKKVLDEVRTLAGDILKTAIPRKRQALKNVNKILA